MSASTVRGGKPQTRARAVMIVKKRVEKDGCKNSMMASKIQFPINSEPFVNTSRELGTCRDNSGLAMTLPLVGNPYICNNSDRQPTVRQHVFRSTIQFSFETDVGRDSDGAERSEALALNLSCMLASKHPLFEFHIFLSPRIQSKRDL